MCRFTKCELDFFHKLFLHIEDAGFAAELVRDVRVLV